MVNIAVISVVLNSGDKKLKANKDLELIKNEVGEYFSINARIADMILIQKL